MVLLISTRHSSYTFQQTNSGLLTCWIPKRFKHPALYRLLLCLTRVLQFLSAVISLSLFSARMYKVYRLVNSTKTHRGVGGSYGAVEDIPAAAVLYTSLATLMQFLLKPAVPDRFASFGCCSTCSSLMSSSQDQFSRVRMVSGRSSELKRLQRGNVGDGAKVEGQRDLISASY
ncbi:hypothetical protein BR93DRAFT_239527 [Coniochaeta sp. PMI_546]|nr:hypothetical protein BR93DRAFT_239527 [Coniochaeta sp. PMI_546]